MIKWILLIIVGFVLLIKGADFLVEGASNVAKKFHIPEIIIGLTIVSIGTSMPELFVSITSAINGRSDMAIGNVIGSNISNLLLILGISSVIRPVVFKRETRMLETPICLLLTIIFVVLCNVGNDISRIDAVILLVLFAMFITYTIIMAKKGEQFDVEKDRQAIKFAEAKSSGKDKGKAEKKRPIILDILWIVLGIALLKIGGDFTVDNAVNIAKFYNLSDKLISVTILAIGTSLPELVTSASAAFKGKSDIAIGNILGSNIFNMTLIIGSSALVKTMTYNTSYNIDIIFLAVGTIALALFPAIPPKNKMSRGNGVVYLIMYGIYMVTLFIK